VAKGNRAKLQADIATVRARRAVLEQAAAEPTPEDASSADDSSVTRAAAAAAAAAALPPLDVSNVVLAGFCPFYVSSNQSKKLAGRLGEEHVGGSAGAAVAPWR
jgi:hypothetical protein